MKIPINKLFNQEPWVQTTTGTGAITFFDNPENAQSTGDLVRTIGNNTSQATVHHDFSLSPGETIEVDVIARNLPGFVDTGSIYLESPIGNRVAEVFVTSTNFQDSIALVWTSPFNEGFAMTLVRVVFGSASTRDSQVEFYRPRVRLYNGLLASRRVLMDGEIDITAGVYTLLSDGDPFNVDPATIIRNGATGELEIRPHMESSSPYRGKVHITPIRSGASKKYYIEARYTVSTGKIQIGFFDMGTSAAVDVNALVDTQLFAFSVYI